METKNKITRLLNNLRDKNPLVHHITNYVTVNDCANITLAIGGAPVMADDINEARDMVALASALVINIGTLNSRTVESMLAAGKRANELGIPVILDPVGAGATPYRTETANIVMENVKLAVIRGNLSEIKTLYGVNSLTKGVDSSEDILAKSDVLIEAKDLAKSFAKKLNTVIAITGSVDIITDGERLYTVENGHKIMSKITGTGCMCTSLIGSFLGVSEDYTLAALAGIAAMGISGEIAYESLSSLEGTGTLKCRIIDTIYNLNEGTIMKRGKINEE